MAPNKNILSLFLHICYFKDDLESIVDFWVSQHSALVFNTTTTGNKQLRGLKIAHEGTHGALTLEPDVDTSVLTLKYALERVDRTVEHARAESEK